MGFMEAPKSGGDFKVYLNYNSKAGRWYTKPDEKDAALFEVTNMTAIFDMANVKPGWILFAAGMAPDKVFDPSLTEAAPKPGDKYKRGFEVDVYSEKNLLGLREFSSTAGCVIGAINDLWDAWAEAPESKTGKLPVVKCNGVTPEVSANGTNFRPNLEIVGWADRPEVMSGTPAKVETGAVSPKADPTPGPGAGPAASSSDTDF